MALLPLAGWAVTDVTVTLYDFTIPYGVEPTAATLKEQYPSAVKVEGATYDEIKEYLTFARVNDGTANWDSNNVGVYSWTLIKAGATGEYNIYLSSNNAKLTIEKATITQTVAGAVAANCAYNSLVDPLQLVTTVPTLSLAEAESTIEYSLDEENWSTTKPSIKKVGNHTVYYRVPGTSNWNAKASVAIGTVEITGSALAENTDYTAPELVAGDLSFQWDDVNGKAVEQTLITAGTTPTNHGTLYYRVDGGAWSTELPTASAAGDHVVYWKVVGDEGYYDVAPANLTAKNIAAVQPTVTAATGATSLVWTGEAQDLLSAAGSATLGATSSVVYTIAYKATAEGAWGPESGVIDNVENVEGTAAGYYQINTKVLAAGNYLAAAAAPITVQIATKPAYTAAPTAADLTWNNADQQLIVKGTGTVDGIVQYKLNDGGWTTDITTIKASDAGDYTVKYKVEAANYTPVAEATIANVKIKKKVLSVKANNVQKTYNGTANIDGDAAVVDGLAAFTYIGRVEATLNFSPVAYGAIDAANKTAGTHEGVLKATTASLEGVSTNYDYTIIPGDLIINQKAITVSAKTGLNINYGADPAISGEYTVGGVVGGDDPWATGQAPVLTTNANAIKPEPGTYTVSFTKGTLKTDGDYKMSEDGENHDGYVIGTANFVVNPDPSSKIVITVLPKTQVYTGVAEDWSNMVPNTDYYVTGLIGSDQLKTAPTFTRSDATNFNVGTYTLTASGAAIDESIAGRYPGGIIYNNSTFEITPAELTATVNQQTVATGATALDQTAWTVTGLQGPDAEAADVKTLLGASLSFNTTEGDVADRADVTTLGTYNKGIMLSITNTNYQLKAGTEFGKLLVISATQFALNPNDVNLESELAVADFETSATQYEIVFDNIEMNIGEWYAMVLPFEVDPLKMVQAFDRYVIFNELNKDMTKDQNIKFTLSLNAIPAGTPFLIKFAPKTGDAANAVVDWNAANFTPATGYGLVKIDKDITPVVDDVITFTGTYTTKNLHYGYAGADVSDKVWWLAHNGMPKAGGGTYTDNNWKKPKTNAHDALPMEAYLYSESGWTTYAPNITVEDFDGQTTSIKSISVEQIHNMTVDGMYNLNGMKMQGVPTQKGVYIMNGKKVVIK